MAPIVKYRDSAVRCARTAEPIEMPFGIWTRVGPKKHVLDGDAHWRHLANTSEPSVCGDDAAFLSNDFDDLLLLLLQTFTAYSGAVANTLQYRALYTLSRRQQLTEFTRKLVVYRTCIYF